MRTRQQALPYVLAHLCSRGMRSCGGKNKKKSGQVDWYWIKTSMVDRVGGVFFRDGRKVGSHRDFTVLSLSPQLVPRWARGFPRCLCGGQYETPPFIRMPQIVRVACETIVVTWLRLGFSSHGYPRASLCSRMSHLKRLIEQVYKGNCSPPRPGIPFHPADPGIYTP